jgi:hypothetical protein
VAALRLRDAMIEETSIPRRSYGKLVTEMGVVLRKEHAEAVRSDRHSVLMRFIRQNFSSGRTVVPVLLDQWTQKESHSFAKGLNRPIEEFVGELISAGLSYSEDQKLLLLNLEQELEGAFFNLMASTIRQVHAESLESIGLFKTVPKAPPAFISFEKILAAKGGEG